MRSTPPHLATPELTYATEDDFTDYFGAVLRGFQEEVPEEAWEIDRKLTEWDRTFGFQVDGRWIATCGAFSRRMTVPGGASVPVAAVTIVTVQAPYRRRGLLRQMMTHQLEDVHRRGEPIASLWASESLIYGRFGYGPAAPRARLTAQTRSLGYLPDVSLGDGSVGEVPEDEFVEVARSLHEQLLPERVGALDRPGHWWEFTVFDAEHVRDGATKWRFVLHYDSDGTPSGYARYRIKEDFGATGPNSEVRIGEMDAASPEALARLWRYLLDLDLVRRMQLRVAPLDHPLQHFVADPRAVQTELADGVYIRVVDVVSALEARTYSSHVDVVLAVRDELLPHNNSRFRLQGGPDGARVTSTRAEPDLSLGIRDLGTVYLGGPTLAQLAAAGRVVEHTKGSLLPASAAFSWHRAPFCPDHF